MKRILLIAPLLLFLASLSLAQTWDWEVVNLSPHGTGVDSLLGSADNCLTLEGETAPRFIVNDQDLGVLMIHDTDPDPSSHEWAIRPLTVELIYQPGGSILRKLMADGSQIRFAHVLEGDELDTLITSLFDPTNEEEVWDVDRSFFLTGDEFDFATIGDFDGDGLFDFAVHHFESNEVTIHFQAEGVDPLTTVVAEGEVAFGTYALDIDNDGQDELFCQRWTYMMHSPPLITASCLLAATPDSVLLTDVSRTRQYFVADMDGDGTKEVLSTDEGTLLEGTLNWEESSLEFVPGQAWSPPHTLWMPLELDEENTPTRFLAAGITGPWYVSDEYQPSVRAPYNIWTPNPDGESYSPQGLPVYSQGATATFLPIDDTETEALFLSGTTWTEYMSYHFRTQAWHPPAGEGEPWQLQGDYSQSLTGLEYSRVGGYGDLDGDGQLEYITHYWDTITEHTWNGSSWVEGRSWPWPEDAPQPITQLLVTDLDGNTTPDLVYSSGQALISVRGEDGSIHWEHVEPFAGVSQFATSFPLSSYDVNGDGRQDLYFGGGVLLLNHSWNGVDGPSVGSTIPSRFAITSVTPNPFNPTTTITLEVPKAGHLRVSVYDVLGRQVAVLRDGVESNGQLQIPFDASELASGTYLVRASINGTSHQVRKVVLLK